jgi:hypothetical protein
MGIIFIESFGSTVGHYENGPLRIFGLPGNQDAVGDEGGGDAQDIEKLLGNCEVLRVSSLQT